MGCRVDSVGRGRRTGRWRAARGPKQQDAEEAVAEEAAPQKTKKQKTDVGDSVWDHCPST